ncbi:MAG: CPXCG motif-containing cysteine-rich protein [Gammaproteobacteria bacterium]
MNAVEPVIEWTYACPHCWEDNVVLIEMVAPPASLIEDCRVCCRPIELRISVSAQGVDDVLVLASE